nr:hypothetical protein Iba_chr12eCG6910 [Ipomoea batatas]
MITKKTLLIYIYLVSSSTVVYWPLSLEAGVGPRCWAAGGVAVGRWRTGAVRDTECERDSEGRLRSGGERERARERK